MRNLNIISRLLLAAVLAALVYVVYIQSGIWLKNQAVDECLNSSKYNTELSGDRHTTTSQEPNKEWYNFCMKEKGYEISLSF